MIAVGARAGAMESANDTTVRLYGYGTYVGYRMHPQWKIENPCIELDGGGVVFGIECWWGSEQKIRDSINGREVVIVPLPDRSPENGGAK